MLQVDAPFKLETTAIEPSLLLSPDSIPDLLIVMCTQFAHLEVGRDTFILCWLLIGQINPIQMLEDAWDIAVGSVEVIAVAEEVALLDGFVVLGEVYFVDPYFDRLTEEVGQIGKEDLWLVEETLGDVFGRFVSTVLDVVSQTCLLKLV